MDLGDAPWCSFLLASKTFLKVMPFSQIPGSGELRGASAVLVIVFSSHERTKHSRINVRALLMPLAHKACAPVLSQSSQNKVLVMRNRGFLVKPWLYPVFRRPQHQQSCSEELPASLNKMKQFPVAP